MVIPAVNTTIQDGALGILPEAAEGIHVKLGVCSSGTALALQTFSDVQSAIDALGQGPLTEAVCQALVSATRGRAPRPVLAMRVTPSTAGTAGTVSYTRIASSTGTFATTGSAPLDAYQVRLLITRTGAATVGAMRVSLDGGDTYGAEVTLAASYVIPNTGITVVLTGSLDAGDLVSFSTKAPELTASDLNTAFAALFALPAEFDFVHVVGAPQTGADDAALASASRVIVNAVAAQMGTALAAGRFIHAVCEAPDVADAAGGDSALTAAFSSLADTRVSVVAGYDEVVSAVSSRIYRRPSAWAYVARLAAIRVAEMPSKVNLGPLAAMSSIGRDERKREALDAARFCTLRTHLGLQGFYVTSGRMMAAAGSDYDLVPNRRVIDKACRIARASALQYLDEDLRVNKSAADGNTTAAGQPGAPGTIDERDARRIEAVIQAALEAALSPGADDGDASAVSVQVNRVNALLVNRDLKIKVRVTPKGYARSISVDIGFQSPWATI